MSSRTVHPSGQDFWWKETKNSQNHPEQKLKWQNKISLFHLIVGKYLEYSLRGFHLFYLVGNSFNLIPKYILRLVVLQLNLIAPLLVWRMLCS